MYSRVYVEITNVCNKSCSFCHGHSRTPHRMSLEEFDTLTDKLLPHTKYLYYHLMGEPLTHPLLPDFIRLASKKGFKSAITTNGTLLSRIGDTLIESGVYKVNISLHSFEGEESESYGDYIDSCLDFADKASRAGVLMVMRMWNSGYDGGKNADIVDRMRQKFGTDEWVTSNKGGRIRHRLHYEYGERFEWPDMDADDGGERVFCYGLSDHFGILVDGTVVPCCLDSDGVINLGNAFETDLSDILNSPRAKAIADGFKKRVACEDLCRRCGYARRF